MLTRACGIVTRETTQPVPGGGGRGDYRCPRCHGRFTRSRTVKDHFASCVRKFGNPEGLHWFDDGTLAAQKQWHLDHAAAAKAKVNNEGGEETGGEDEDEEEDDDLGGMDEDESRRFDTSA